MVIKKWPNAVTFQQWREQVTGILFKNAMNLIQWTRNKMCPRSNNKWLIECWDPEENIALQSKSYKRKYKVLQKVIWWLTLHKKVIRSSLASGLTIIPFHLNEVSIFFVMISCSLKDKGEQTITESNFIFSLLATVLVLFSFFSEPSAISHLVWSGPPQRPRWSCLEPNSWHEHSWSLCAPPTSWTTHWAERRVKQGEERRDS